MVIVLWVLISLLVLTTILRYRVEKSREATAIERLSEIQQRIQSWLNPVPDIDGSVATSEGAYQALQSVVDHSVASPYPAPITVGNVSIYDRSDVLVSFSPNIKDMFLVQFGYYTEKSSVNVLPKFYDRFMKMIVDPQSGALSDHKLHKAQKQSPIPFTQPYHASIGWFSVAIDPVDPI